MSRQNKGTPQKFTQDWHLTLHPHEHERIKTPPLLLLYVEMDKPGRA